MSSNLFDDLTILMFHLSKKNVIIFDVFDCFSMFVNLNRHTFLNYFNVVSYVIENILYNFDNVFCFDDQ